MNRMIVAALALGLGTSAALAQTASDSAPAGPAQSAPAAVMPNLPAAAPEAPAPSGQPTAREVREQCRADAQAQGLKGEARKAAVQDCFAKARPDLAKRQECREQGKAQGLADKALHAYVKSCVAGA